MADIARAGLTFVGYYFFGPWGALAGSILGQILFPAPGVKGPRISELNVQQSTVGAPIPLVYGTYALAGNVIWSGGLFETKHEDEQGGFLGVGGQKTTSYTYSCDVAIGICEGEISGIRRIWADADLIFDASDDETLEERFELLGGVFTVAMGFDEFRNAVRAMSAQTFATMAVYLGTEDQMPDPTIEGHIGDTSAFRGLAYVVFDGFELAKYGNRIPNFRFEVYTGTATECGLYSPGVLYPWVEGTNDPRNELNNHVYAFGATTNATFDAAMAAAETAAGRDLLPDVYTWQRAGSTLNSACFSLATQDRLNLQLLVNSISTSNIDCILTGSSCADYDSRWAVHTLVWAGGGADTGLEFRYLTGETPEQFYNYPGWGNTDACASPNGGMQRLEDIEIQVQRTILPPDPCALGTPLAGAPGWCVVGGQVVQGITWTEVAGTFKVLQSYDHDATFVTAYPVGPALSSTDTNYSNQAYWEAAYADALAASEPIAPGLVYGVDYPEVQSFAYFSECQTVDTECVPMAVIVSDLCRRAGLRTDTATQIDVSGLTTCVPGYAIGRQMSARDAMGPLRLFGLWDAVEGEVLRFVERGGALVATITEDDLGAHENGSEAPSAVEVSRVQEKELPRRVRLHFGNFLHDHEPSEQSASRITTEAVEELDVEVAVSMEPDTAAQLAEIHLYDAWISRNSYTFALDNDWLHLEPTDCIEIPVDGETQRVRIVAVEYSIGGILRVQAIRDDDGTYVSTATARPQEPSGGSPVAPGQGPICPSEAVLLDIPRLREADIDAGYYVAIYGLCPETWTCAELYRSSDGGVTYGRVARTNDQVVVGEIDAITGPATDPTLPGESPAYDTTTSITVTLFQGELSSITDAQIAAGQNMAAVGVDGRWVIIQFKTATFDTGETWVLTDLIWGLNETEHNLYTTVAGDTFVLLSDPALIRVPEEAAAIGVEKQFKAVTCGESIDSVTALDFTTWGLSYRRTCPSTVISATITDPPSGAADGDAYLLPNDTALTAEWADHGGEIAHWSDETGAWVFCTPVPGTIVTIGVDSSSDPGDDSVISDGDGNYNPAPWTPAIPPLPIATPIDTDYFVFHDGTGYKKGLLSDIAGGGFPTTDTSDIGIALDELTDVVITAPASGEVLTYDSTGWHNEAPTGGAGGMTHVAEQVVVGTAAGSITISGLDLDTDEIYFVVLSLKNATAGGAAFSLFYNSDTTATNYYRDAQSNGSATQANDAVIGSLGASTGAQVVGFGIIKRAVSRVSSSWQQALTGVGTGLVRSMGVSHVWTTTATNVTGITINTGGSIIDIGSSVNVWRLTPP